MKFYLWKRDNAFFLAGIITVVFGVPGVAYATHWPDLGINKIVIPQYAPAGSTVEFRTDIKNIGDIAAVNVEVTDVLTADLVSTAGGATTRKWTFASLAPGESKTFSYSAKLRDDLTEGWYLTTATVQASNHAPVQDAELVTIIPGRVLGAVTTNEGTSDGTQGSVSSAQTVRVQPVASAALGATGIGLTQVVLWIGALSVGILGIIQIRKLAR